jgi:hypothetical protein
MERDRDSQGQHREDDERCESTHKNPPAMEPPSLGAANYTPYHGAMKTTVLAGLFALAAAAAGAQINEPRRHEDTEI